MTPVAEPLLEAEALCVDLGGRRVLEDVTLSLGAGEFLALCGPNGGGKTTFLKSALGLLPSASGRVRLLGEPPERTRSQVGYLPQRKGFAAEVPATVAEVIAAAARAAWPVWISRAGRERVLEALRLAGAEHLADLALARLSGGELQRVFLARALVRAPRLLLLDEPTAGVDAKGRREFFDLLESVARSQRLAMLLVTHSVAAVQRLATRLVYLDRTVRADGAIDSILEREGLRGLDPRAHDHADGWPVMCEEG